MFVFDKYWNGHTYIREKKHAFAIKRNSSKKVLSFKEGADVLDGRHSQWCHAASASINIVDLSQWCDYSNMLLAAPMLTYWYIETHSNEILIAIQIYSLKKI